jgi:hypothetical protein
MDLVARESERWDELCARFEMVNARQPRELSDSIQNAHRLATLSATLWAQVDANFGYPSSTAPPALHESPQTDEKHSAPAPAVAVDTDTDPATSTHSTAKASSAKQPDSPQRRAAARIKARLTATSPLARTTPRRSPQAAWKSMTRTTLPANTTASASPSTKPPIKRKQSTPKLIVSSVTHK